MTGEGRVETATLAGGCFWCLDGAYRDLRGVISVESGYTGGNVAEPTALGPAPARVEYAVFAVGADEGTEQAYRRAYLDGLAAALGLSDATRAAVHKSMGVG